MEGLEHRHVVTLAAHVGRHGDTGRSAADHRDLLAGSGFHTGHGLFAALTLKVGHVPFDAPDGNSLIHILERLPQRAGGLTLHLLRTNAAAHRRQQAVLADDRDRLVEPALSGGLKELRNADPHRAPVHARRILALETALGFELRLFGGVAEGDLAHVVATDRRILRRHLLRRNRHAVSGRERFAGKFRQPVGGSLMKGFGRGVHIEKMS